MLGIRGYSKDPLSVKQCFCCQHFLSPLPRAQLGLVPGLQLACMCAQHFTVCKALPYLLSH